MPPTERILRTSSGSRRRSAFSMVLRAHARFVSPAGELIAQRSSGHSGLALNGVQLFLCPPLGSNAVYMLC
ncbi:hypothetical protein BAUCODRAFT_468573 [Baudoinia panamericana UAMH 10762]|uniref:Uncharacterized protein n=1 Tax=Baudoinia panamericana (strain UAMH 10762) TaxID=717646 RepID=M2MXI9_BAUPA|nr:uncharacterized protein BAUCODRAFT_468573 [Baudoinia panamericana UAMH 10762]EMC96283.1 hypothetical protein BAUCODRAFT_468573 [Baudoinia panamericana UAMH 10762]